MVMLEATGAAIVPDADEERSTLAVGEPGDCLQDLLLHLSVVGMSASGRLELHVVGLAGGDQLPDRGLRLQGGRWSISSMSRDSE